MLLLIIALICILYNDTAKLLMAEVAGIGQDQRCRPHPEEGQENPERLGKQAERTGRPESRNHPRHPGRERLGQRTARHTGGRSKRRSGNP